MQESKLGTDEPSCYKPIRFHSLPVVPLGTPQLESQNGVQLEQWGGPKSGHVLAGVGGVTGGNLMRNNILYKKF